MLLEFQDIHKNFGEAAVLKGIDLSLESGQILGLIGENGAGKSTLMNILGGLIPPTAGRMLLDGQPFQPASAQDAQAAGIAFIHQELNLFPNLSVAENLLLQNFPRKKRFGVRLLDHQQIQAQAQQLLDLVGLNVAPTTPLAGLTPAQRQQVEIAKALSSRPRLIIFDEPTTSLTRHEVQRLFELIRRLQTEGMAMIYISHNLEDVMQLADEIAVLRDGELVARYDRPAGYRLPELIHKMVGRDMDRLFPAHQTAAGTQYLLEVERLTAGKRIRGLSFAVKNQEVLGFYGLVGAGRSEMARMVYGLDDFTTGTIRWKGQPVRQLSPDRWIARGVGFLTEDRREEGLLADQSIEQNIRLAGLRRFTRPFLQRVDFAAARIAATEQAQATRVKYQSLTDQPVATLSGGNQQKVVLAKWLLTRPELLILDEPTKGIDIGAKYEIYTLIHQLVAGGAGVWLISSEVEELIGLCDRILVMSGGRISAEFTRSAFDRSAILEAALHT